MAKGRWGAAKSATEASTAGHKGWMPALLEGAPESVEPGDHRCARSPGAQGIGGQAPIAPEGSIRLATPGLSGTGMRRRRLPWSGPAPTGATYERLAVHRTLVETHACRTVVDLGCGSGPTEGRLRADGISVIVETPNGFREQGPELGNELQRHKSGRLIHDFEVLVTRSCQQEHADTVSSRLRLGPAVRCPGLPWTWPWPDSLGIGRFPRHAYNLVAINDVHGCPARLGHASAD